MGKRKIHYSEHRDGPLWETACGSFEVTATDSVELVTCKRCIRKLTKQPVRITEHIAEAIQETPALFDEHGLPVLTPETYRKRDCACGSCPVCKHVALIAREQFVAPWLDRPRVHVPRTWRWPSVNAALHWYADQLDDGYPQKTLGAALEALGKIGATIQGGAATDAQAIQDADDRVTMERALVEAAQGEPVVQPARALEILFAVAVGQREPDKRKRLVRVTSPPGGIEGLSAQAVGNLVKRMKRRLYAALRGMDAVQGVKQ